jgi:hypothetical protein
MYTTSLAGDEIKSPVASSFRLQKEQRGGLLKADRFPNTI